MAWNMVVDPDAAGTREPVSHEQLWDRLGRFLDDIMPVAEEAGVTMAAHPDDPPFESLRGTPRLVHQPSLYQRLIDRHPSPANGLEFCIGTLAEMTEGDIYEVVDQYSRQDRIAYVHLRNVHGRVPRYHETFLDDGDIDMRRVLADPQGQRLRGRDHPRPHPPHDLRRPLARRHGLGPRLDPRGDRPTVIP